MWEGRQVWCLMDTLPPKAWEGSRRSWSWRRQTKAAVNYQKFTSENSDFPPLTIKQNHSFNQGLQCHFGGMARQENVSRKIKKKREREREEWNNARNSGLRPLFVLLLFLFSLSLCVCLMAQIIDNEQNVPFNNKKLIPHSEMTQFEWPNWEMPNWEILEPPTSLTSQQGKCLVFQSSNGKAKPWVLMDVWCHLHIRDPFLTIEVRAQILTFPEPLL